MSSPAEPKRRRLDDDLASSSGVSFVAQDVSENASAKTKAEPAITDTCTALNDADGGSEPHARLKAALERQTEAQDAFLRAKDEEASNSCQRRSRA